MRTLSEKIEDLKDFIKHAENNFALVTLVMENEIQFFF